MPRRPLTEDDLDYRVMLTRDQPDLPGTARWFEQVAAEPHPRDEVSAAQLLVLAGDFWLLADRPNDALERYRRAVADGGMCVPDVRCALLRGLLACGLQDEAQQLRRELKAAHLSDLAAYNDIGEVFEQHGDLAEATRWFTAGVMLAERDLDEDDWLYEELLVARWRVRAEQGFPPDEDDREAAELIRDRLEGRGDEGL